MLSQSYKTPKPTNKFETLQRGRVSEALHAVQQQHSVTQQVVPLHDATPCSIDSAEQQFGQRKGSSSPCSSTLTTYLLTKVGFNPNTKEDPKSHSTKGIDRALKATGFIQV